MFVTSTNVSADNYRTRAFGDKFTECVLFFGKLSGSGRRPTVYEESVHRRRALNVIVTQSIFPSWYSSSVPLVFFAFPKKVPQATDRNGGHPYIGWAVPWPLSQYPQCLQLFTILFLSLPPSLPPSRHAPIGSRACRLLAPSHQNLAKVVRICPHTNRSLAFCPWMDGTESERRDKVKGRWGVGGGGELNVKNPSEYAALWVTRHFSQWSRTAIVKRH